MITIHKPQIPIHFHRWLWIFAAFVDESNLIHFSTQTEKGKTSRKWIIFSSLEAAILYILLWSACACALCSVQMLCVVSCEFDASTTATAHMHMCAHYSPWWKQQSANYVFVLCAIFHFASFFDFAVTQSVAAAVAWPWPMCMVRGKHCTRQWVSVLVGRLGKSHWIFFFILSFLFSSFPSL